MKFQPSPNKEDIMQALREGQPINEVAKRFPESPRTIKRYAKELREGKPEKPKEPGQKIGGELATVQQPSRGAIVFTLGEHKISLNPQHLYDAYLYYEDIVLREEIDEEFSLVIKVCVKSAWERLNRRREESRRSSISIEEG